MQYDIPVIDPQVTTGTDLANILNAWALAVESTHSGPARPAYAAAGLLWLELVDADNWNLKLFGGAADVIIGTAHPVSGTFSFLVGGRPAASQDDAIAYAIALG